MTILIVGLVLTLAFCLVGAHCILTVEVTGNETVTDQEIMAQLRLCGVSQGTWGPGVNSPRLALLWTSPQLDWSQPQGRVAKPSS